MACQTSHDVTVRDILAIVFPDELIDWRRRHSENGDGIRINSLVLARPVPRTSLCRLNSVFAAEKEKSEEEEVQSHHLDVKPELEDSVAQKEKFRVLCNIMCLSVAFMILSTSFIGTVDLQSSVNANQGLGTISLTSMYIISIISNLCLPSIVIRWLGCKRTVAICFLAYIPFITAQLDGTSYTLIPGAVLIGVALGPIHCAAGIYLQMLARSAPSSKVSFETALVRLMSIFYVFISLSQVWGSGITALVLADSIVPAPPNSSLEAVVKEFCGPNFCPNNAYAFLADPYLRMPSTDRVHIVIKIYLLCAVVAFLIVILGVSSIDRYKEEKTRQMPGFAMLTMTVRLMKNRNQLLIIPITIWGGMHKAFIEEEFTQAYVNCGWGISEIGTVMICYGIATVMASLLVGIVCRATLRNTMVCLATILQVGLVVILLNWQRASGDFFVYMLAAMLWAVPGSTWLVQLNILCNQLFPGQEEAAFSNYRLWDAVGFIIASGYSPVFCMRLKLYLQLLGVVVGAFFYLVMVGEGFRKRKNNTLQITKVLR